MRVKRLISVILAIIMLVSVLPIAELSASAASYSTVRKGDRGNTVKTLQVMLNAVDKAGLAEDGIFGSGTQKAVKNFQKANKLDVDGIVGPKTWAALEKKYEDKSSSLKIGSGNYNPGSLLKGKSYSIKGKITSDYKITSVTVGVYKTNGTATAYVKTVKPNAKSYDIKGVDSSIKFGSLATGTYDFIVKATDASGTTKTLVCNEFTVKADAVAALKERALENWVAPVKKSGYLNIKVAPRYFGARRDSGARAHAGIDIHYKKNGKGTPVYAMEAGKVVEYSSNFYGGMQAIAVQHADGSIARYCEISTSLRVGSRVTKGQQIATIAKSNIGGDTMLHLEIYMGTASGKLSNKSNKTYDYVTNKGYNRRRDLVDPSFVIELL
ncbi:MAG: peptidoglycan-binding protein [Ruminococcus sp.]|nr:peptidoglycan-binding protein [Ruminococcus sp.]